VASQRERELERMLKEALGRGDRLETTNARLEKKLDEMLERQSQLQEQIRDLVKEIAERAAKRQATPFARRKRVKQRRSRDASPGTSGRARQRRTTWTKSSRRC
jgi:phage shock protein A